jgi:heat shock protein HslJ
MARPGIRFRIAAMMTVVAIALGASACSGGDDSGSSSSKSDESTLTLTGDNWVLMHSSGTLAVPSAGTTVTARFQDGSVTGDSGCNTYRASYSTKGATMTIGSDIATTRRTCEPGPTAVEQAYLARLPRVASYRVVGSTLSLLSRGGAPVLVYRAGAEASRIRGPWNLTGYYTASAIQSVVVGTTLTAEFAEQVVSGDGGCNQFDGPYETTGEKISIGPLASTLRSCGPAVDTQETQYLAALELARTFRTTGNQLELLRADGGIAATFERAP